MLLEWGDRAMKWIEQGGTVQMYRNDKRPDVLYLILIGRKGEAQPVDLKALEVGDGG